MSTTKKIYNLTKMKQLVDLNGDTTNFDLTFSVTSKDKAPFDVIVVDQATLDSDPDLDYKHVTDGSISGNIISDKGVYQNYFLMLKADTPCQCEVITEIKEVPVKPLGPDDVLQPLGPVAHTDTGSMVNWQKMLVFAVVVGAILYYLYFYKTDSSTHESESSSIGPTVAKVPSPVIQPPVIQPPVASSHSSPAVSSPILSPVKPGRSVNESLLARLNKLPMRRN